MKMAFCATVMECLHVLLLYTVWLIFYILYFYLSFVCVCVVHAQVFFFFRKLPNARLGGARPAQAQSHVTGRFSWTANKQPAVQKKSEIEAARAAVCRRRRRRRRHSPVELWFFSLFLFLFLFLLLLQLLFSSFILF